MEYLARHFLRDHTPRLPLLVSAGIEPVGKKRSADLVT